jgi:hypothetical protein
MRAICPTYLIFLDLITLIIFGEEFNLYRSKARTVFNRSNTGIVDSNPARGMDVCPRSSVLCSPV